MKFKYRNTVLIWNILIFFTVVFLGGDNVFLCVGNAHTAMETVHSVCESHCGHDENIDVNHCGSQCLFDVEIEFSKNTGNHKRFVFYPDIILFSTRKLPVINTISFSGIGFFIISNSCIDCSVRMNS